MKTAALAAAALTFLSGAMPALADEPRPHVQAVINQQRQKAEEAAAEQGLLTLKGITAIVLEEQNRSRHVTFARMFENPEREDDLKSFGNFLALRPVTSHGGGTLAPGEEANRDRIIGLYAGMRPLQDGLHPAMLRIVRTAVAGEFAKRGNKLRITYNYVDSYFAEEFKKFDAAFHKFKQFVNEMVANGATDISGPEVLMASGLGEFATDHMKTQPRFDKLMRSLDTHLRSMDDPVLSKLTEDMNIWQAQVEAAIKAYEQVRDILADSPVADSFKAILDNYAEILAQAMKVVFQMDAYVKDAEGDTIMGKVRAASYSLAPHGSLQVDSSGVKNGNPVYVRRVRLALEDCRDHYLKAARSLNSANRNTPGYKPMQTEWR